MGNEAVQKGWSKHMYKTCETMHAIILYRKVYCIILGFNNLFLHLFSNWLFFTTVKHLVSLF
jgi:hypothetical protein